MYKRLYTFLSKHNCIYELQFGFRNGHSTNHALLDLTEDIRNALKNKSLKQLKKHLNYDLRKLVKWLKANKISLNASKTEKKHNIKIHCKTLIIAIW